MEEKAIITHSPRLVCSVQAKNAHDTEKLGKSFTKHLKKGDIVLLRGELGAGKTTFVRGLATGLGIKSRVISPTFVLVRNHKGKLAGSSVSVYHVDLYRIESARGISNLGLEEVFQDPNGLTIIEWGDRSKEIKYNWEVTFKAIEENTREIEIIKNE